MLGLESVAGFSFVFLRSVGFLSVLPLGFYPRAILKKAGITFALTLLFFDFNDNFGKLSLFALIAEFLVGAVLALPTALAISMAALWGELFDSLRGQTIGSLYEPNQVGPQSQVAVLSKNAAWLYFLLLGGLEWNLKAYADSFSVLAPGLFSLSQLVPLSSGIIKLTISYLSAVFTAALPLAMLFFASDLFFGFFARALPQVTVFGESFQFKTYLGFLFIAIWIVGI